MLLKTIKTRHSFIKSVQRGWSYSTVSRVFVLHVESLVQTPAFHKVPSEYRRFWGTPEPGLFPEHCWVCPLSTPPKKNKEILKPTQRKKSPGQKLKEKISRDYANTETVFAPKVFDFLAEAFWEWGQNQSPKFSWTEHGLIGSFLVSKPLGVCPQAKNKFKLVKPGWKELQLYIEISASILVLDIVVDFSLNIAPQTSSKNRFLIFILMGCS